MSLSLSLIPYECVIGYYCFPVRMHCTKTRYPEYETVVFLLSSLMNLLISYATKNYRENPKCLLHQSCYRNPETDAKARNTLTYNDSSSTHKGNVPFSSFVPSQVLRMSKGQKGRGRWEDAAGQGTLRENHRKGDNVQRGPPSSSVPRTKGSFFSFFR